MEVAELDYVQQTYHFGDAGIHEDFITGDV
jgi:hypothetical protein